MVNTEIRLIIFFCSQRWRSSIESAKTRPGAACGSDHELLTAKFRLKLKKIGKTTRPFRYDLNKIPHDYTVEVTNRFKGLDLIKSAWRTMDGFLTLYRRWWLKKKKSQRGRNAKRQNDCLRRLYFVSWEKKRSKRKRSKGKTYSFECRVLKNSKER